MRGHGGERSKTLKNKNIRTRPASATVTITPPPHQFLDHELTESSNNAQNHAVIVTRYQSFRF